MKKLKLTLKQIENIYFGKSKRFKMMEDYGWKTSGSHGEMKQILFKDLETDCNYIGIVGRTENGMNGYVFDSEIHQHEFVLLPCEEKEVLISKWCYSMGDFETEDLTGEKEV